MSFVVVTPLVNRSPAVIMVALCALSCRSPATGAPAGLDAPLAAATPATVGTVAPEAPVAASPSAVPAKKGFEVTAAVLYQGDSVLAQRIADIKAMAAYNDAVKGVCNRHLAEQSSPELLDVVIALRPGRRCRVWFVSSTRAETDAALTKLRAELEKLPVPEIQQGPVAFALLASVGGAQREKPAAGGYSPPMPADWKAASQRHAEPLTIPDGILADVWP